MYEYQAHMVRNIRRGYDGTDEDPNLIRWTIPAALMYCITIYTTIGINHFVKTMTILHPETMSRYIPTACRKFCPELTASFVVKKRKESVYNYQNTAH